MNAMGQGHSFVEDFDLDGARTLILKPNIGPYSETDYPPPPISLYSSTLKRVVLSPWILNLRLLNGAFLLAFSN
jgi:hypothetical protein